MYEQEIIRTAELAAGRQKVWRHLTEPALLGEWLGADARFKLVPGGELALRDAAGERRTGWVEDVEPGRRLCFWWRADEDDDATRVELELTDVPDGTRVTVTESRPMAMLELRAAELVRRSSRGAGGGPTALATL